MKTNKQQKYLIVKGCAGLGNRLYTIASALEYCQHTNRTLVVDWADNLYSNNNINIFNKFFNIINFSSLKNIEDIPNLQQLSFYPKVWGLHYQKSVADLYVNDTCGLLKRVPYKYLGKGRLNILKEYWRFKATPDDKASHSTRQALLSLIDSKNIPMGGRYSKKMQEDVIFFADYIPEFNQEFFKNHIAIADSIQEEAKKFMLHTCKGAVIVGIHIRCTDNRPPRNLDQLYETIRILNAQANTKIFIATDNIEIQTQLTSRYANVVTFQKLLPTIESGGLHHWAQKNGKEELAPRVLEESLIELAILTYADYLLYQSNSSFSNIAQIFHKGANTTFDWTSTAEINSFQRHICALAKQTNIEV